MIADASTAAPPTVRDAVASEVGILARLWHDGWQDAHARIVPAELKRARTLASFAERLAEALPELRVAGAEGAPLGFYQLQGEELYQLYVAAEARGAGVAAILMADAEARLAARGVATAWLECAIGNGRAARFYEKSGWRRVGNVWSRIETALGPIDLEVWRYEKPLGRASGSAGARAGGERT